MVGGLALALLLGCVACVNGNSGETPNVPSAQPAQSVIERRQTIRAAVARGAEAVPDVARALEDENVLVRRAAVRALCEMGPAAGPTLIAALDNSDVVVRRAALSALIAWRKSETVPLLERALHDSDPDMRLSAVRMLAGLQPHTQEITRLLSLARGDREAAVRKVAADALWPFYKAPTLTRQSPAWADHPLRATLALPFPKEAWRFKTDRDRDGHLNGWYAPSFNDAAWKTIPIGAHWQKAGVDYQGVAWYRRTFVLPAKRACVAVELAFGAVDESAWVWINGEYVGQHDLGPAGWEKPFRLDATDAVQWGRENQITVRVLNTALAGGIYKPVVLEAFGE